MTQKELQEITKFIALNRGNCSDSKEFWKKFFELLEGFTENIINYEAPLLDNDTITKIINDKQETITIIDDGKKKTSELMDDCRELFNIWSCWDNDELNKEFPTPKKPTKRTFAYTQEPDEKYKNMSANYLIKAGIKGITLREQLIFELLYFKKEDKHLDIDNWTLCAGSRCSDGRVPSVSWYSVNDKLNVYWTNLGYANGHLRCRVAI